MLRSVLVAVTVVATLALTASCSRTPTTPTSPQEEPVVIRVELLSPASLAPDVSAQLRLIAHLSNGTTQDVTQSARFLGESSGALEISPDGRLTGLRSGEGLVTGFTDKHRDTREIVVVPEGTFRVVGRVFEEGYPDLPVDAVRIDADGIASATTDSTGTYRLFGVAANARLRAPKAGYVTKELTLAITDHQTQDIPLAVVRPRMHVAGVYQLTIEAGAQCRGRLPDALLTRRYSAEIVQRGGEIQLVVTGARFFPAFSGPSNRTVIPGRVEQEQVSLDMAWPSHCERTEPDFRLVEIVDDATYLEIFGAAVMTRTGQDLSGTLINGAFQVHDNPGCGSRPISGCGLSSHRVTLTR